MTEAVLEVKLKSLRKRCKVPILQQILKLLSYRPLSLREKIQPLHCLILLPVELKGMRGRPALFPWQEVGQKLWLPVATIQWASKLMPLHCKMACHKTPSS
ncbi:hypothetical protein SHAL103562_03140 [Shewanella algae]